MNAALLVTILQFSKTLIGFIRELSDNDDVLQAIVDKARAEGREISKQEVQDAATDMSLEVNKLEKLLSPPEENTEE